MTAALAGFLFVASAGAAQGTDLRSDLSDLASLVAAEESRADRSEVANLSLREEIQGLTAEAGGRDAGTGGLEAAATELAPAAGFEAVTGAGVVVTLDDAPDDAAIRARAGSLDDLVVHQQDLLAVLNALWLADAEGIMLMDQRLISTSAVRCVGNTLSLQGTPYSPPYVITAVGDPAALTAALEASEGVQLYREYVDAFALGYEVRTADALEVPAYTGPVDLQHASVATRADLQAAGS